MLFRSPPMTAKNTDTPALPLQAELGTTCGLWLLGAVTVGSAVGAGDSGVIGAANLTESTKLHQ